MIKSLRCRMCFILSFCFSISSFSQNNDIASQTLNEEAYRTRLSEYFYNQNNVDVLVPVRLMGNVNKPGLYHVPPNTSLLTLLSISGGPAKDADVENIQHTQGKNEPIKLTLSDLMVKGDGAKVSPGDIVYIPEKQVLFDRDTVNATAVITGIASVILTAILVSEQLKD